MTDFAADTKRWAKQLRELGKRPIERALDNAASDIGADLVRTFNSEQDPHGRQWKERVGNQTWPINNHTGYLDSTRSVERHGNSIVVSYDTDYSDYVDAERQLVPDRLPKKWKELIDERVNEELDLHLSH